MSKLFSSITVLFLCFSITACSVVLNTTAPKEFVVPEEKRTYLADKETVKGKLYQRYDQWKSTEYKMGGLSKNGIDCSGFVYSTYLEIFGIELPRSTKLQSKVGKEIQIDKIQSGDLVFFKTGWTAKHVGIYIENNSFLHASTKKGVMISRLDDHYWKSKYWQARRVQLGRL